MNFAHWDYRTECVREQVARALIEDIGDGDASAGLIDSARQATARILTRDACVIAGRPWFDAAFISLEPTLTIDWKVAEGAAVAANTCLVEVTGRATALLSAERTALNFLQLLSCAASEAARLSALIAHTRTRVLDTRKTIPGLRLAQKYAVWLGGGTNHRLGLYDAILLKENHIAAAGSITAAVAKARALHPNLPLEVEVENFRQLEECLALSVPRVMLDNFSVAQVRAAVALVAGAMELEASGGITDQSLVDYAEAGVDFISVGALTKNVRAVDLSMRLTVMACSNQSVL